MRRIFKRKDGGVSVIIPAPKSRRKDETEAQWLERVFDKSTPDGVEYEDVSASEIPSDRTFRNAWVKNSSGIEVDMPKARAIHMDKIRVVRNKELERLDKPFMIALEDGDDIAKSEIGAQKKSLRDIPQTFDLTVASTPDELKVLWPNELN